MPHCGDHTPEAESGRPATIHCVHDELPCTPDDQCVWRVESMRFAELKNVNAAAVYRGLRPFRLIDSHAAGSPARERGPSRKYAESTLEELFSAGYRPEVGAGPSGWPKGPAWNVKDPLAGFWLTPGLLKSQTPPGNRNINRENWDALSTAGT